MFENENDFIPSSIEPNSCVIMLQIAIINKVQNNKTNKVLTNKQNYFFNMIINIQDINDNAPYWLGHLKQFGVKFRDGDPVGSRKNLPPAIDIDTGVNARLIYKLDILNKPNNQLVPLSLVEDPVDGLHLYATKLLDREEHESYKFILKAIDGVSNENGLVNTKQFTSSLIIDVVIEDVNDNTPQFTQPIFTTIDPIPETTSVGTTILILNATDLDSGINGAFHFGFSKEHYWSPSEKLARKYFNVRSNGHIVVKQPLNVDTNDRTEINNGFSNLIQHNSRHNLNKGITLQFKFRVIAEDEAIRPYTRSSEATVSILVSDENDEAPIINIRPNPEIINVETSTSLNSIKQITQFYLMENKPIGSIVAFVQVNFKMLLNLIILLSVFYLNNFTNNLQ